MRVWIAIWTGSSLISRAICAWIGASLPVRLLALVLAAGFIKGLPGTTIAAWSAAAAWLGLAITLGLRHGPSEAHNKGGEGEPPMRAALTLDQLSSALHHLGSPHAHLKSVAEACGTTPKAVREKCEAAGIPISSGVRMGGRVSTGIDRRHFPPRSSPDNPPLEPPAVAVVAAGQSDNNGISNAPVGDCEEGMSIIQDSVNPRRWHVMHHDN